MFVLVDPEDKQLDLFPPHLLSAELVAASLPARSGEAARTDSLPATDFRNFQAQKNPLFFDLRRCSTADQSGLPDFSDF